MTSVGDWHVLSQSQSEHVARSSQGRRSCIAVVIVNNALIEGLFKANEMNGPATVDLVTRRVHWSATLGRSMLLNDWQVTPNCFLPVKKPNHMKLSCLLYDKNKLLLRVPQKVKFWLLSWRQRTENTNAINIKIYLTDYLLVKLLVNNWFTFRSTRVIITKLFNLVGLVV